MNIGLFFGSFNPFHVGHKIIASYIRDFTKVQQVWFVVSPQSPMKTKKVTFRSTSQINDNKNGN